MLRPSASNLFFWLRYLPGKQRRKKVSPVRFELLNSSKVSGCSVELSIGVSWQKCFARQLPNRRSGWVIFQARPVHKSVTCQVRNVELSKVSNVQLNSNWVYVDGIALPVSFQTLVLVDISSRQERFTKVSPVRFEMLNLIKVSDVECNSTLAQVDENALPVSF